MQIVDHQNRVAPHLVHHIALYGEAEVGAQGALDLNVLFLATKNLVPSSDNSDNLSWSSQP